MSQLLVKMSTICVVFVFLISCTHTALFSRPNELVDQFPPATSRNWESYQLEKELAYSRTMAGYMTGVGYVFAARGLLGALNSDSFQSGILISFPFLALSASGFVASNYFHFLSERAGVYLSCSGVKVFGYDCRNISDSLGSPSQNVDNQRPAVRPRESKPTERSPVIYKDTVERIKEKQQLNDKKDCLLRKCVGTVCWCPE